MTLSWDMCDGISIYTLLRVEPCFFLVQGKQHLAPFTKDSPPLEKIFHSFRDHSESD